jgi:hypothetical protein
MLFARSLTFGRCGSAAYSMLGIVADNPRCPPHLIDRAVCALQDLVILLTSALPRSLTSAEQRPALLFTDGACEPGHLLPVTTIGAVLILPELPGPLYFGARLSDEFVSYLCRSGKKQIVGQAELLPIIVAKSTWQGFLANRPCITFVDNESAKSAAIAGYSPVIDSSAILTYNSALDVELQSHQWVTRVPTSSNTADGPSRLDFAELAKVGSSVRYSPVVPSELIGFSSIRGFPAPNVWLRK